MSDLDRIVGQLRQDVADRRWPEPDQIRSRGARRAAGQVVAGVAAAVAVLVAGSAGAFAIAHGGTDHGTRHPQSAHRPCRQRLRPLLR